MNAALLYGLDDIRLVSMPAPTPEPREVLVKVLACGVCQTDLRKFDTLDGGSLSLPMNLGHEFVGEVVAVGTDISNIAPGMRLVGDGYLGYADLACMKLDMTPPLHVPTPVLVPPELSDELATFIEPMASCIHALQDQARVSADDRVAVIGAGTMGCLISLAAVQIAKEVVVFEPLAARRAAATEMGAHLAMGALVDSNHLAGSFDVVVVTVGAVDLVQSGLELLSKAGRLVLFAGFPSGTRVPIDVHHLHYDELSVIGSEWAGVGRHADPPRTYREAIELLCANAARVERLVSEVYALQDIGLAFARARSLQTMKIIVKPTTQI